MKWKYQQIGIHIHVIVFMNDASCGKLTFREEEFNSLLRGNPHFITFEEA